MEEHAGHHSASSGHAPSLEEHEPSGSIATYTVGLAFALLLTAASFIVSQTNLLWEPGVPAGLAVLAIAQMGVHLVFFLHISTGPDNTNNVIALAFGVLIVTLVVSGSLWIMANLNSNMLPPSAIMQMQR
ncbi:MAG TPA: cytochrome o ubiquinol oxidase subunit IV [Steroidobacteraceae bacterium]|jgi:cytochrome o ubiquinol oxidase operon protein cyoD